MSSVSLSSITPNYLAGRVNHLTQTGVYLARSKDWYGLRSESNRRAVSGHCGVLMNLWLGEACRRYLFAASAART